MEVLATELRLRAECLAAKREAEREVAARPTSEQARADAEAALQQMAAPSEGLPPGPGASSPVFTQPPSPHQRRPPSLEKPPKGSGGGSGGGGPQLVLESAFDAAEPEPEPELEPDLQPEQFVPLTEQLAQQGTLVRLADDHTKVGKISQQKQIRRRDGLGSSKCARWVEGFCDSSQSSGGAGSVNRNYTFTTTPPSSLLPSPSSFWAGLIATGTVHNPLALAEQSLAARSPKRELPRFVVAQGLHRSTALLVRKPKRHPHHEIVALEFVGRALPPVASPHVDRLGARSRSRRRWGDLKHERLLKNTTLSRVSLCLSRACLGKMIIISTIWGKRGVFLPAVLESSLRPTPVVRVPAVLAA